MDLVLFDIDGTLIRSMADDTECLVMALHDVFGFVDVEDDWSQYENITEAGIVIEAFQGRRGRPPSSTEIARFRDRFVELLTKRCLASPLKEVDGAASILTALRAQENTAVAFATGCFLKSAVFKMESARLSFDPASSATCDDAITRDEIMRIAIRRAASQNGVAGFKNTVYVGDAIWDVWACRRIGVPLIGISADIAAVRLRDAGVALILPDFRDQELFHEYRKKACGIGGETSPTSYCD